MSGVREGVCECEEAKACIIAQCGVEETELVSVR